ncbi:MAG: putative redox protein [Spirosomataceae bacterium]|jgi:putative redox protein
MATSTIKYSGNLRTEATHTRSGKEIITDAPVDNNGKGEAFSPTDLAATSLASCAMTIIGITAAKDDVDFTNSEIEMVKTMSVDTPRRIIKIELDFRLKTATELSEAQQKKYQRVAYTCPVALSLHPDIEQVYNFTWL